MKADMQSILKSQGAGVERRACDLSTVFTLSLLKILLGISLDFSSLELKCENYEYLKCLITYTDPVSRTCKHSDLPYTLYKPNYSVLFSQELTDMQWNLLMDHLDQLAYSVCEIMNGLFLFIL